MSRAVVVLWQTNFPIGDVKCATAFVPLAIAAEPLEPVNRLSLPRVVSDGPQVQVLTLDIGPDVVMRVPGDVPVERVAALVRATRERA